MQPPPSDSTVPRKGRAGPFLASVARVGLVWQYAARPDPRMLNRPAPPRVSSPKKNFDQVGWGTNFTVLQGVEVLFLSRVLINTLSLALFLYRECFSFAALVALKATCAAHSFSC